MANTSKKKPTSNDVALLAGVSQTTVSQVLNGNFKTGFSSETVDRVINAAKKLGYSLPARKASKSKSGKLILVLIPTLTNLYYAELIQPLEEYADSLGYKMLVCNTFRKKELEGYYLEKFVTPELSGVIYTFLPSFPDMVARLAVSTPFILIGEKKGNSPISSIELSNVRAGAMLADHLFERGHRHLCFITTPMNHLTMSRRQRLEGITSRMKELGESKGVETSVLRLVSPEGDETDTLLDGRPYEYYVGRELTFKLLDEKKKATALVGANDMVAVGILSALEERGLFVPKDYAVSGFDNTFLASVVTPGLTTIDHMLSVRCPMAVDMIVDQEKRDLAGEEGILMADKVEYMPKLIIRGSTG